jgi:hypothetical protein
VRGRNTLNQRHGLCSCVTPQDKTRANAHATKRSTAKPKHPSFTVHSCPFVVQNPPCVHPHPQLPGRTELGLKAHATKRSTAQTQTPPHSCPFVSIRGSKSPCVHPHPQLPRRTKLQLKPTLQTIHRHQTQTPLIHGPFVSIRGSKSPLRSSAPAAARPHRAQAKNPSYKRSTDTKPKHPSFTVHSCPFVVQKTQNRIRESHRGQRTRGQKVRAIRVRNS